VGPSTTASTPLIRARYIHGFTSSTANSAPGAYTTNSGQYGSRLQGNFVSIESSVEHEPWLVGDHKMRSRWQGRACVIR